VGWQDIGNGRKGNRNLGERTTVLGRPVGRSIILAVRVVVIFVISVPSFHSFRLFFFSRDVHSWQFPFFPFNSPVLFTPPFSIRSTRLAFIFVAFGVRFPLASPPALSHSLSLKVIASAAPAPTNRVKLGWLFGFVRFDPSRSKKLEFVTVYF